MSAPKPSPHHYIELITPAIQIASAWWAGALTRCNALSDIERTHATFMIGALIERKWRAGCDRDMCLWEEDMPPVIVTAMPEPGCFLIECMQATANHLGRDLVWRSRCNIEMSISVERVWLRLDGEESELYNWKTKK